MCQLNAQLMDIQSTSQACSDGCLLGRRAAMVTLTWAGQIDAALHRVARERGRMLPSQVVVRPRREVPTLAAKPGFVWCVKRERKLG